MTPVENWAVVQIQLLKQQIFEMEKLVRSGGLRSSAPAPTVPPPPSVTSTAAPVPARRPEYRQEYHPDPASESRHETRSEQRLEQRLESRLDHPMQRRPSYSESRALSVREPSPAPVHAISRSYNSPQPRPYEELEHRPASTYGKPPYGQKEYDYGEAQRGDYRSAPSKDSYGKAPLNKSYANTRQNKPYDKPNGRERTGSPPPSRYASSSAAAGGRPMDRRGSWDSRGPKRYSDAGYRY